MIGADIYGYALVVSRRFPLAAADWSRFQKAADALERSLDYFPAKARPYYERVLSIAHLAPARA